MVAGDYDQVGTTQLSDRYTYPSNGSLNDYRDYTFNETGEESIDKTGYSIFSQRTSYDILRSAPTGDRGMQCQSINYTGTTRDPKLVVEHSASSSIKSINGLAKASIKSRNSLAIGSIKSINGLE